MPHTIHCQSVEASKIVDDKDYYDKKSTFRVNVKVLMTY